MPAIQAKDKEENGLRGWAKTVANMTAVGVICFLVLFMAITGQEKIWEQHRLDSELTRQNFQRFAAELKEERQNRALQHSASQELLISHVSNQRDLIRNQQETLQAISRTQRLQEDALRIIGELQKEIALVKRTAP